jgi:hypothetical protein
MIEVNNYSFIRTLFNIILYYPMLHYIIFTIQFTLLTIQFTILTIRFTLLTIQFTFLTTINDSIIHYLELL